MKTIVLTFLVALSLVLTVALWNYQPKYYDEIENTDYLYETKLNGQTKKIEELITPYRVLFRESDGLYGLKDHSDLSIIFSEIQKWQIDEVDYYTISGREVKKPNVEIAFPTELPLTVLQTMFTLEEKETFPDWEFDRIIFRLVNQQQALEVIFASSHHDQTLNAKIQNSEAYAYLERYFINKDLLMEMISFTVNGQDPFYLPAAEIELPKRTFTVNKLQTKPMINILFSDPSLVETSITSFGERNYTDGNKQLSVYNDYMYFVNPLTSDDHDVDKQNMIRRSINFVNDHQGWTNEFRLTSMDEVENTIEYQMTVDYYPVFHPSDFSVIEIEWKNQQIHAYNRPLMKLATLFHSDGQKETLSSGYAVMDYLENHQDQYDPFLIEDIQIGYTMKAREGISHIMSLEPEWYIKYNGRWQLLFSHEEQGEETDAVGTN